MKVSLKLIATYRKLLPEGTVGNTLTLDLPEGTNVVEALAPLGVPLDRESVILLNGHVPELEQQLHEGDVIYAFPAMAGGSG